jgi:hypothetical protein
MTPTPPLPTPPTLAKPLASADNAIEFTAVIDQSPPPMTPLWIRNLGRPPERSGGVIYSPPRQGRGPSREPSRHSATRLTRSGFTASESFSLEHSLDNEYDFVAT